MKKASCVDIVAHFLYCPYRRVMESLSKSREMVHKCICNVSKFHDLSGVFLPHIRLSQAFHLLLFSHLLGCQGRCR